MRRLNVYTIIFLISLLPYKLFSQINCTVPLPPVLTSVSVQYETDITELYWTLSPSSDIAAYIIYSFEQGSGTPIDTIWDPLVTSYLITNSAPKYFSVSYVVAAYRAPVIQGMDGCPSPLSNDINTIFCSSEIDTCKKEIKVKWNYYNDYPKHVLEYRIYGSVNGSTFSELSGVGKAVSSVTLTDFATDSQYCFFVRAILEDGSFSGSNKSCLTTKMQRPPEWINANQATINDDNKVVVSFTADPFSEIKHFILERKTGSSDSFQMIAQLSSANNSVIYTDMQADVNHINYYRLSAINGCSIPITISNTCSNIVLSIERIENDLNLTWNGYRQWLGSIADYRLFVNTGRGFEEKAVISSVDTTLTVAYNSLMYEVSEGEICFYILASETYNPFNINGISRSSVVCTSPAEVITVPNIFTPDNDLLNDFFKPVLSFTPIEYHLIISDRKGKILFDTRDSNEEWSGSWNGKQQGQGVYLWFLKVTTPSGKSISKTGTVTIINSKQ